jgi:hypothetical protein
MMSNAQTRAVQNYRSRLSERGLARFEVQGLETDRELIRTLARRLAQEGLPAAQLRQALEQSLQAELAPKGRILAALRRSPLVGAALDLCSEHEPGQGVAR